MPDLTLTFGNDLNFNPDGDLMLATGTVLTEQRVLRRLLTNKGDYIWQPGYGAGLAQFIGKPAATGAVSGLVNAQLVQESRVAMAPAPQTVIATDRGGNVMMSLQYTDATVGQVNAIQVPL